MVQPQKLYLIYKNLRVSKNKLGTNGTLASKLYYAPRERERRLGVGPPTGKAETCQDGTRRESLQPCAKYGDEAAAGARLAVPRGQASKVPIHWGKDPLGSRKTQCYK